MTMSADRVELLGTNIDNLSMNEAIDCVVESIDTETFSFAVTPNVDHLMKLRTNERMQAAYRKANLVLADGVPLLWASAILGTPLKERVNGTDLFERLCEAAAVRGYGVYLLGGNPGAAAAAARVLSIRNPGLRVAGSFCPEFGFESDPSICEEICKHIKLSKARILFVGLGAPKQEEWIEKYARATGVHFAVGIGISFSLVSGEVRRAPRVLQRAGFEWFWRLCVEPQRLWRRYLFEDMPFILIVACQWIRKHRDRMFRRCRIPALTWIAGKRFRSRAERETASGTSEFRKGSLPDHGD